MKSKEAIRETLEDLKDAEFYDRSEQDINVGWIEALEYVLTDTYVIRDLQFDYRYFADGEEYGTKKECMEQLASYHDIDYDGVKDDGKDTPYEDIYEFLATLPDDQARLDWILEYGQWELEVS